MTKPPALGGLRGVAQGRRDATRAMKCATCAQPKVLAALRALEVDMKRTPAAYTGVSVPDIKVWCGVEGILYGAFRDHLVNHHPALWAMLRGRK